MTLELYLEVAILACLIIQGILIHMNLDQLKATVAQAVTVEEGARALIADLAVKLAAYKNEPDQIQALADSLTNASTDLQGAITTNTASATPAPATAQTAAAEDAQVLPAPTSLTDTPTEADKPAA